jgi:hypothetical protein
MTLVLLAWGATRQDALWLFAWLAFLPACYIIRDCWYLY